MVRIHELPLGLINFAPEEEAQAMEIYRTRLRLFERLRYDSWIVSISPRAPVNYKSAGRITPSAG